MQHLFWLPRCLLISSVSFGIKTTICPYIYDFRPHYWRTFWSLNMSPKASTAMASPTTSTLQHTWNPSLCPSPLGKALPHQYQDNFPSLFVSCPLKLNFWLSVLERYFLPGRFLSPTDEIRSVLTSFCSDKRAIHTRYGHSSFLWCEHSYGNTLYSTAAVDLFELDHCDLIFAFLFRNHLPLHFLTCVC